MKKWLWLLITLGLATLLLAACSRGSSSTSSEGGNGGSSGGGTTVMVHTSAMQFAQPSITIKKGDTLKLVNDASDIHIISLGTWNNGTAKPEQESGAPNVQNQQLAANSSIMIGPWNTAGTYHLYCSVHTNMKLTVNVQ